jgi:hypothetical protein
VGAGSGSLSGAIGEGAALAVGTVIAQNTLNNTTQAYVGTLNPPSGSTPAATTVNSAGPVAVTATSTPTISAEAVAVAAAGDLGESFAGAGAGANATTTLGPSSVGGVQVLAGIVAGAAVSTTAQPTSGPAILVEAQYEPTVTAGVGTGALSASFVGTSVGVSLGTITDNTTVQSLIQSASVSAPQGTVEVLTHSQSDLEAQVVPTALSLGLGSIGSASGVSTIDSNAQYLATVVNANAITAQTLQVQAQSQDALDALTQGGAGGVAAIGVFLANATRGGSTSAQVELPATLAVNNLTIAAQTNQAVNTNSYSVTIGLTAGAGQNINSTLTENVQAQLLNPLNQAYTLGGQVSVLAQSANNLLAETGLGLDVGLLLGAGAYLGTATAQPNVAAVVQANLAAQGDILVSAEANNHAAAHVKSGFGSLIGGVGTTATTNNSPTVATTVGGTLSSGGDLRLGAGNVSTYSAVADNSSGGVLGVGSGTTSTNNGSATVTAGVSENSVLAATDGL